MDWSFESLAVQIVTVFAILFALLYFYVTIHYDFWLKKGVPQLEPSFPFGNIKDLVLGRKDFGTVYGEIYTSFKGKKFGGFYELRRHTLMVIDLDLVRQVLVKDFNYFTDRMVPFNTKHEYTSKNLVAMEGEEWKEMRTKLSPTFTSGKMKMMYSLIEKCCDQLKNHLVQYAETSDTVDVKETVSRFTLDIIATCGFGLDVNTLADSNTDIFRISRKIFRVSAALFMKMVVMMNFPSLGNFLKFNLFDAEVKDFILSLVETTVKYREKNNVHRNDFLDLLIKVKNNEFLEDKSSEDNVNGHSKTSTGLTLEQMAAQAFIFFAAGFETAASTTTFALYELARHPEVQERLRQEIDQVMERHDGQATYQALQEMVYMDKVINETLRRYASLPFLVRKCVIPYTLPGTEVTLQPGDKVIIPTFGIHHDPDIYQDPYVFDPERFSEENIKGRHHYAFLPFGEGPRICIGMRFGKMQVKAGLATILSSFSLNVTEDTEVPVTIAPHSAITMPLHPIQLRVSPRDT